jgi:hypothetical protein
VRSEEGFSDGVFAIAITLLVLTIAQPSDYSKLARQLLDRWPSLAAYVVSFLVIGIMWLNDHTAFSYVQRIDHGFFHRNLVLLMTVVFIPYPTEVFCEALRTGAGERTEAVCSTILFVAGAGVYLVSIGIAFINPYLCLAFHGALALYYAGHPISRRLEHAPVGSAPRGRTHADPIPVGIGENRVRRRPRVVDDGPSGGHRPNDPVVGHLRSEPQVEMPALAGSVVLVGALEPQAGDPARGIEDRVVDFVVGATGEQYRPKGREPVLVCGIECDLELGHRDRVGFESQLLGNSADRPRHVDIFLCDP